MHGGGVGVVGARNGRRVVKAAFVCCIVALACACAPALGQSQYNGRELYQMRCASCHGANLEGSADAPPLIAVDAAYVDFMLQTGRMPAAISWEEEYHHAALFNKPQIAAIVDYVMSRSRGGKALPAVHLPPDGYGLKKGRQIYDENCEQCHGATGRGDGAVGYANVAPSLMDSTPLEIAEAVREGPDVMPRFGPRGIDDESLGNLIAYIRHLQTANDNPGGLPLANWGPVSEGFIVWTFGTALLVLLVRRIGSVE